MKKKIILPIIAVIAAVILFGGCFYTTQPNEYTIVRASSARWSRSWTSRD